MVGARVLEIYQKAAKERQSAGVGSDVGGGRGHKKTSAAETAKVSDQTAPAPKGFGRADRSRDDGCQERHFLEYGERPAAIAYVGLTNHLPPTAVVVFR